MTDDELWAGLEAFASVQIQSPILIDHREWKDWRSTAPNGALGMINAALLPFGVALELAGPDEPSDWIEIIAKRIS